MFRLVSAIWGVIATTLAGSFVLMVLIVPELSGSAGKFIPLALLLGAVVAVPVSCGIVKKIEPVFSKWLFLLDKPRSVD